MAISLVLAFFFTRKEYDEVIAATVLTKRLLTQATRRLNTLICCFSAAEISSESAIISFGELIDLTRGETEIIAVTYAKINNCEKKPEVSQSFRDSNLSPLPVKLNFFWLRFSNKSQLNQISYFPFQFALKQF